MNTKIEVLKEVETFNQYQNLVHEKLFFPEVHRDLYLITLLNEEAGEVGKEFRKRIENNEPIDTESLTLELGDVLWCISMIAKSHGITLEDVANHNVHKLKLRGKV